QLEVSLLRLLIALEDILQCKLHDSRIESRADLPELSIGQGTLYDVRDIVGDRPRTKAVWYIEHFGPNFDSLTFMETKCTRQCQIKVPGGRSIDTIAPDISERADRRTLQCRAVEPGLHR